MFSNMVLQVPLLCNEQSLNALVSSSHFIQSGERTPQRGGPPCVRHASDGHQTLPLICVEMLIGFL